MFTLAQIDELHARLGSANTLADYLRALRAIGVERFESYLRDGHSEFFGADGHKVVSPPHHEELVIADTSDPAELERQLALHARGETSYVEMSRGLAACGIEKWIGDALRMTMSYCDKLGRELVVEPIA